VIGGALLYGDEVELVPTIFGMGVVEVRTTIAEGQCGDEPLTL
jgi:hypothetical protein